MVRRVVARVVDVDSSGGFVSLPGNGLVAVLPSRIVADESGHPMVEKHDRVGGLAVHEVCKIVRIAGGTCSLAVRQRRAGSVDSGPSYFQLVCRRLSAQPAAGGLVTLTVRTLPDCAVTVAVTP